MSQAALIVNPNARQIARRPRLLSDIRNAAGERVAVHTPSTLAELDQVARAIIDQELPRVLLVGGDGSTMSALSALHRAARGGKLPAVSLSHAGTVGTISRCLGMRLPVMKAVARLAEAGADDDIFDQPTLQVDDGSGRTRVGFIFGTGLVSGFFEKYDAAGGGLDAAALITARLFLGSMLGTRYAREVLTPMPACLRIDGRRLEPEAWGVIVSSVLRNVGLHVLVTYRGSEDPERPHLVATPLGPRGLGRNFPRVIRGRPIVGAGTFDGLVKEFQVSFEGRGAFVLDGDTLRTDRVTVTGGPVVRMLRL